MAQVSMTVRMDSQLKQNFDALCARMGMSANAAMNIFANAVVMQRKIPFEIKAEPERTSMDALESFREIRRMAEAGQFPDLTLDEIDFYWIQHTYLHICPHRPFCRQYSHSMHMVIAIAFYSLEEHG